MINSKKQFLMCTLGSLLCLGLSSCAKAPETSAFNPNLNQIPVANTPISTVTVPPETPETTVVFDVGNYGRINPFAPYRERQLTTSSIPTIRSFNIKNDPIMSQMAPPPSTPAQDPGINSLMQAKVVGILYDRQNSSAIINILGNDQLVHVGDAVFDFYIKNISKNNVLLKNGANTYEVGVGEIIDGTITNNNVYNLNRRFAGAPKIPSLRTLNSFQSQGSVTEIEVRSVGSENL